MDLPGAGQVTVAGDYAYVGHIPNKQRLGTSILDVRDPKNPRVLSQISLEDPDSHSHKARVAGDIMIVNSERNMTPIARRAEELPRRTRGGRGGRAHAVRTGCALHHRPDHSCQRRRVYAVSIPKSLCHGAAYRAEKEE
jgi:hypothetical protein